jgi:uncharacterized membrane protein
MKDAPGGTIRAQSNRKSIIFRISLPFFFVILAIDFGLAIAVLTPPYQAPDEPNHLLRAYQVSEGTFAPPFRRFRGGGFLPSSIAATCAPFFGVRYSAMKTSIADILNDMRIPLKPDVRMYYDFPNTATFSPLSYVPQALAIKVGRSLGCTTLQLLYLGRFANLFFWTGAGYLALRIAPGFQRPFFLLMLMPMSLFQAASLSTDGIGNSFAFLFGAMIWKEAVPLVNAEATAVSWVSIFAFGLLSMGIGLTKLVYLPLIALMLLIPAQRFGGNARRLTVIAAVVLAGISAQMLWTIHTPGLDTVSNGVPGLDIFPRQNLHYLREHPAEWFYLPLRTIRRFWWTRTIEFVGSFGWADLPLSGAFCVAYLAALVWACRSASGNVIITTPWKWSLIIVGALGASIFALCFLGYIYWNMPGNTAILGLQGRYFIPLTPAVLILICAWVGRLWQRSPSQKRPVPATHNLICAMIAVAALGYALLLIRYRYYLPG